MIKFLSLDFLGGSQRILWKNENAIYRLQISALVPEISKFEKCLKYANEMTDDVIFSTQNNIMYINRAILANLQRRPLKLGRLIVFTENTSMTIKHFVPMAMHSFPVPTHLISICKWFSAQNTLNKATNSSTHILNAFWIMYSVYKAPFANMKMDAKGGQKCL